jgi:metalloprotein, YbeY/UPF0054 family
MARIRFFSESIDFSIPRPLKVTRWIKDVIKKEGFVPGDLNFIFCDDDGLLEINVDFLDHDTYTDIITFDNSEEEGVIEGDIFISVDRIKENAANLLLPFEDELHRVMIHGVLHLMGYKDKRPEEKKAMREKEDACLELRDVPRGT